MSLPRLRDNILALGSVQAGNYLVPLLTLPYLARVLGAEGYGQVVFVQTVMLFGTILVDFGFSWSATRQISASRHDSTKVATLFANTWTVQWILAGFFSLGVLAWAWLKPAHSHEPTLYIAGLGIVLGQVLFPIWLFQGLEALRLVAAIQLLSKLLSLPFVFWWVKNQQDQVWALFFFSTSAMLSGFLSLGWISYSRMVRWCSPSRAGVLISFREASLLFASRALISLYTTLVPLAVGTMAGSTQLAYFNLADKLKTLVQSLLTPVSQALFPRMSLLFQSDKAAAHALLRKTGLGVSVVSGLAGLIIWIGAEWFMSLVGGAAFAGGASVLRWLAFVPSIVALSNLFGIQIMLPRGMNRPFTAILAISSVVSLCAMYPFVSHGGAIGAAQLVLLVELVVTSLMAIYLWLEADFRKKK